MAIFSTFTVVRTVSILHLIVAYFLLVNPNVVADQNLVVILGEAMDIPVPTAFLKPTESTALASLFLIFLSTTDLLAASLPTRSALEYYSAIVPVRLLILFALTIFIYLTGSAPGATSSAFSASPDAILRSLKAGGTAGAAGGAGGVALADALDLWKNSLVFSIGFVEACTWFWVYTLLRDERREFVFREAQAEALREEEIKEKALYGR